MHIANDISLHDLQTGFEKKFPGLKLEFIFSGNEKLNLASHLSSSFPYVSLKEICPNCPSEGIEMDETMTTGDVEKLLKSRLNLPACIYVSNGGYWQKD